MVKDMWRRVHLLNYFVLKFHVLLNFEPIYSRLSIHSIITSTCETIFHLSFLSDRSVTLHVFRDLSIQLL